MAESSVKRPKRVSFIALLLICVALLSSADTFVDLFNPGFFSRFGELSTFAKSRYFIGILGFIIMIVAAFNMLKGRDWSRWLYIVWITGSSIFTLVSLGLNMTVLYGLGLHIVFIVALLTPKSNQYFTGTEQQ